MIAELLKPTKPRVMVVDDSKVVRWSISKILGEEYLVHAAEDAESAMELLKAEEDIALIFCDLQMPGMDGHQFLKKLREDADPRLINLPIIIISGEEDTEDLRGQLLEEGATDFVLKPFDESIIRGRVAAYVNYQQQIMRLERDIELDPISGLAGRNYFQLHVERNLTLATRHKIEFTLAILEVDDYKKLLTKLGKKTFIQLLFQIGKRIKKVIRSEDLASRIDQARFGLVLPLTNRVGGRRAIERVCKDIDNMVLMYAGEPLKVNVSVGMSVFEIDSVLSACGLIGNSEEALRQAISSGGNCVISSEELDDQRYAAVDHPPVWFAEDPSIDLIRDIQAGVTDRVSDQELRQLLIDLRPILELADQRMNLGLIEHLREALKD